MHTDYFFTLFYSKLFAQEEPKNIINLEENLKLEKKILIKLIVKLKKILT